MTAEELVVAAAELTGAPGGLSPDQTDLIVGIYTEFLDRFGAERRRETMLFNLVDAFVRARRFDDAQDAALYWGPRVGLPEWRVDRYLCDNAMTQRDLPKVREHAERVLSGENVPREARASAEFSIAYSHYLDRDFARAETLYEAILETYGHIDDPRLRDVVNGARGQIARIKSDGAR